MAPAASHYSRAGLSDNDSQVCYTGIRHTVQSTSKTDPIIAEPLHVVYIILHLYGQL